MGDNAVLLNAYTAVLRGKNNATGVGVVEAYDLDHAVNSRLANISTRGLVQTEDNVLIGGMIVLGQNPLRVLLRAIGPSLTVSGALGNPTLELRDTNGALILANNDWQDNPIQAAELIAAGLAPSNNLESGISVTLSPGLYTALLAGRDFGTGIGVVEVYDLGAP